MEVHLQFVHALYKLLLHIFKLWYQMFILLVCQCFKESK